MPMTTFSRNAVLNSFFRNTGFTQPVTVFIALFTVAPTVAGGGTEVTGGSYARTSMAFAAASAGTILSNADCTFPTATADWAAGATKVVAWAAMDALTSGNMWWFGSFAASQNVLNGQTVKITSGSQQMSIT